MGKAKGRERGKGGERPVMAEGLIIGGDELPLLRRSLWMSCPSFCLH